jgi:DNA-binding transcriptional ArsR family regulator
MCSFSRRYIVETQAGLDLAHSVRPDRRTRIVRHAYPSKHQTREQKTVRVGMGSKISALSHECKQMHFMVIIDPMHTINLTREDYEVVLTVADEESVTRAATQLHLSQSAVSHHLRALEARLGTPLFFREPRRMVLSPVGEEFVSSARQIIGEMRRADSRLSILARTGRKLLTIGTECYTSYH